MRHLVRHSHGVHLQFVLLALRCMPTFTAATATATSTASVASVGPVARLANVATSDNPAAITTFATRITVASAASASATATAP